MPVTLSLTTFAKNGVIIYGVTPGGAVVPIKVDATGLLSGGGNPFNQDLNTTNSPTLATLTLTGNLNAAGYAAFGNNTGGIETGSIYFSDNTDGSTGVYGFDGEPSFILTGNQSSNIYAAFLSNGVFGSGHTYSGDAFGVFAQSYIGSGVTASGRTIAVDAIVHSQGATVATGYGVLIESATVGAGGTFGQVYGLYVGDQHAVGSGYNIYSVGASSLNKFEGTIQAGAYHSSDDSAGISTTVTTASLVGKTITIKNGLITAFA